MKKMCNPETKIPWGECTAQYKENRSLGSCCDEPALACSQLASMFPAGQHVSGWLDIYISLLTAKQGQNGYKIQ